MKIYKIAVNPSEFQLLLPTSKEDSVYDLLEIDGLPKENKWQPVEFYVYNPLQKRGNFFSFSHGGVVFCDKLAVEKLSMFLRFGAELLPVFLEDGTELFMLNVTDCVNALDQKNTIFDYYEDGTKGQILKFVFHENRFSESSIFKIPETAKVQILTFSGTKSPEDEFYNAYMDSGLVGLNFELLYSG